MLIVQPDPFLTYSSIFLCITETYVCNQVSLDIYVSIVMWVYLCEYIYVSLFMWVYLGSCTINRPKCVSPNHGTPANQNSNGIIIITPHTKSMQYNNYNKCIQNIMHLSIDLSQTEICHFRLRRRRRKILSISYSMYEILMICLMI